MLLSSLLKSFMTSAISSLPLQVFVFFYSWLLMVLWVLSHFAGAEIRHDGVGHDDKYGVWYLVLCTIFMTGSRISEIGTNIQIIRTYMLHQHKILPL